MKTSRFVLIVALAALLCHSHAWAQYKSARGYFPKNNTVPGVTNPAARPASGQAPGADTKAATKASQPKFQDLSLNSQFYFLSDTNRTYAWTKLTATAAKNTKNGVTAPVRADTPVQK